MAGEGHEHADENVLSGWTVDTLRIYLLSLIDERAEADRRAIVAALTSLEKRLDAMNEFRASLADQSARFVRREEYDALVKRIETAITERQRVTDALREQLGTSISRAEYTNAHSELVKRMEAVAGRVDQHLAQSTGEAEAHNESRSSMRATLFLAVGASTVILALLELVLNHV